MSLAADLSTEIDGLADVDGVTIELDTVNNQIRLKESIAAPASGQYTFASNVEISGALTVDGVDVMDEISTEVSRAESAEASIANTYFRKLTFDGDIDGTNTTFGINQSPLSGSVVVYLNGLLMDNGDCTVDGNDNIVFNNAPLVGDKVAAYGVYFS
jgi:hypothetical protein